MRVVELLDFMFVNPVRFWYDFGVWSALEFCSISPTGMSRH